MPVKELPFEIWENIASFIPEEFLWYYRHLNSAFYSIALDARYRSITASMEDLQPGQNWRKFLGFRDKDIGRRVRTMLILFQDTSTIPRKDSRMSLGGIWRTMQKISGREPKTHLERIAETVEGLINLSALAFHAAQSKLPNNSIPALDMIFRTCSSSLTTLSLELPLLYLSNVLKLDVFFPHLASLSISSKYAFSEFNRQLFPDAGADTSGKIVPFLNRHRLTLTALYLPLMTDTDGSSVAIGLACMPSLEDISINVSHSSEHGHIRQFLAMVSPTLRSLAIDVDSPASFRSITNIVRDINGPFHNLQYFSISQTIAHLPVDREHWDLGETANFIQSVSSSLVTLSLENTRQTTDAFFNLLDLGERMGGTYPNLQHLAIPFHVLTPEILDFLASHLPNLQKLKISADKVKIRNEAPDEVEDDDTSQFYCEMRRRDYSYWKLKDFWLANPSAKYPIWAGGNQYTTKFASAAIAVAIPSLETFDNVPLKEFISNGPLAHLLSSIP